MAQRSMTREERRILLRDFRARVLACTTREELLDELAKLRPILEEDERRLTAECRAMFDSDEQFKKVLRQADQLVAEDDPNAEDKVLEALVKTLGS